MKKKMSMCLFLTFVFLGLGCASQPFWKSQPHLQEASNEYYVATISPIYVFNGYKGFILTIHNKSPDDVEVDWDNTFYIHNGKKMGGFIFRGMRSGDKPETPSIISGSLFSKEIFPRKLSEYSSVALSTIQNPMEVGENGVYLTVKVSGTAITGELTLNFSQEPGS